MPKPLIQVVSPPSLKLHEWQKYNQAEKSAQTYLANAPGVIQVCKAYYSDLAKVHVRIRVRVHRGTNLKNIPKAFNGVPTYIQEE